MRQTPHVGGGLRLLQAVRCLAALVVVWHHTEAAPQFGHFGVDLFFVLSGCVMARLMANGPEAHEFFLRRVLRVWPMYALATFALVFVTLAAPSARHPGFAFEWGQVAKSLGFIPYENSRGEIFPFLSVGWTLVFEMAFYLCCAAALLIAKRHAWSVAASLAVTLLLVAKTCDLGIIGRFFGNPIILEFVAGLLVWQLWQACNSPRAFLGWIGVPAILSLPFVEIYSGIGFAPELREWGRPLLLLPLASLVIYAALELEHRIGEITPRWLASMVRIGDASYSIYLTHLFVVGLAVKLSPHVFGHVAPWPPLAIAVVTLSAATGIGVHEYVDAPLQRWLRRFTFSKPRGN